MAKYSRSSQGMLESIQELSQQKAEQFLNTFYFQYGHRSIADLAHLVFGVEQISILAAIALVDEPLWDGQERSTRYQPFRATGWYTPPAIHHTEAEQGYRQTAQALFGAYESLTEQLHERLIDAVPRPPEMAEGTFRRTLRARAFDVSRALLPLATHTSVGQVVSARVLERQVSRLLSSPIPELQAIGDELKQACQIPAQAPLLESLAAISDPELLALIRPAPAPTLVKYAERSDYLQASTRALEQASATYLRAAGSPDYRGPVELPPPAPNPLDEIVATLLYKHDQVGHSYRQSLAVVADLSAAQKQEVLDLSLQFRGRHDDFLREHQAGYTLTFDVCMDLGSFRDLHRHRRCVQIQQPHSWKHGYDRPEEVFRFGLGPAVAISALEAGLGDTYAESLEKAALAAEAVDAVSPGAGMYLLPLAYRTRCLFKMDWAQAAYIIELRTGSAGHFSYRRTAWAMFEALRAQYPGLTGSIRATNPADETELLQR